MVKYRNEERTLAVEGKNIYFNFGRRKPVAVLNGVNICVEKGVIYGLLGPSGCGKTTLLRCIVGSIKPKRGQIRVYGKCPGDRDLSIPGRGVGYMPQELALYQELSMEEFLNYFGCLYEMERLYLAERIAFLERLLDIPDKRRLIKYLSGGQQRRVSFAAAIIHEPPLLILDEPTVGVDPLLRKSIWDHFLLLSREDCTTIVFTTHYIEEARQANRVGLMRKGQILAESNPEILIRKHNLSSLEKVFLKLCRNEATEGDSVERRSDTIIREENISVQEEANDSIWVTQKVVRSKRSGQLQNDGKNIYPYSSRNQDIHGNVERKSSSQRKEKEYCNRMRALINKDLIRLKRNIFLLIFELFLPALQVILFFFCIGGDPYDLPVAVTNMENISYGFGNTFLQTINNRTINQKMYSNISLALQSVRNGDTFAAVYIGPHYTSCSIKWLRKGTDVDNETIDGGSVKLYLDMSSVYVAFTIHKTLLKDFQTFIEPLLEKNLKNPLSLSSPVVLQTPVYGKTDQDIKEFIMPGFITSFMFSISMGLSIVFVMIEKNEGLLDRIQIAGVSHLEVILTTMFNLSLVMAAQSAILLVFTYLIFHIPFQGPLVWIVICVLLTGVCGMMCGFLISAMLNEKLFAFTVCFASFHFNYLLCGLFWPLESMPRYYRYFSYCLPLTLITDSFRFIASRGWTITNRYVWQGFLVSLAWVVMQFGFSLLTFKIRK